MNFYDLFLLLVGAFGGCAVVLCAFYFLLLAKAKLSDSILSKCQSYEQSMFWHLDSSVQKYRAQATDKMYKKLKRLKFYCAVLGRQDA